MTSKPPINRWQQLAPHLADEILSAPKTWCDPLHNSPGECPDELERVVNYLLNNVVEKTWLNHLTLLVQVLYSHHVQHKTLMDAVCGLHKGFSQLFSALNLSSMTEWEVDKHFTLYLSGQLPQTGSEGYRFRFWRRYASCSNHLKQWFSSLPQEQQCVYQKFVFPCAREQRELTKLSRGEAILQEQKDKRKAETDTLMPFYMDLRTQTHLRFNLVTRIFKAYLQAIQTVQRGNAQLPLEFELYEGGDGKSHLHSERLVFKLWDRRTFVLYHKKFFHEKTAERAQKRQRTYSETKNPYYLEFVRAEALNEGETPTGLWFVELFQHEVMGHRAHLGTPEETIPKQTWLQEQGYTQERGGKDTIHPFCPDTAGLLIPSYNDGKFNARAWRQFGTLFLPLQKILTGVTFAMVAIHILTANGMRITELLQLQATPECFVPLVIPPPPDAEQQTPSIHWEARVIPKGHKKASSYYFDDEHLRLLSFLKFMLCEHYHIDPKTGGDLPMVPFRDKDELRIKPGRFLFQYGNKALSQEDLRSCMRFLVHGLVFQTLDGRRVTVLPHLLRHGFATWALNIAKEPIDIVARILNQKNIDVTKYYGKPTPRQIAERSHGLMTQISSYIDVGELLVRSPEEIQHMLLAAQRTHGTLTRTRGGKCLLAGECPILFACIGCAAKAPDPACREEVEEVQKLTLIQIQRAQKRGLTLEALQYQKKLKQCETELHEMDLIELYRADEQREPEVRFDCNT